MTFLLNSRKQGKTGKTPGVKRKLANVALTQPNDEVSEEIPTNSLTEEPISAVPVLSVLPEAPIEVPPVIVDDQQIDEQLENAIKSIQSDEITTTPSDISPGITPVTMDVCENNSVYETPSQTILAIQETPIQDDLSTPMEITPTELITTPVSSSSVEKTPCLVSPTTPSVPKERKRRIIIDDDDESPTFNPLRSTKKIRGKNRRKSLMLKKQQGKAQQLLSASIAATINATDKSNETAVFTSPEAIVSGSFIYIVIFVDVCFVFYIFRFKFVLVIN